MLEGWGAQGGGGIEGENWENCNSIINKNINNKKKAPKYDKHHK